MIAVRLRRRPLPEDAEARQRSRRDSGSMSVYAAVMAPALFLCVSLFVNATVRWNTWRDANAAANAAARAAVQVSPQEFNAATKTLTINPGLATQRARSVLNASGYDGSVSVSNGAVSVEVTATVDYVLPGGWFGPQVTGHGNADLESGVLGGSP